MSGFKRSTQETHGIQRGTVLTLMEVIMQGASVAGAGGGDLGARHVTIGC